MSSHSEDFGDNEEARSGGEDRRASLNAGPEAAKGRSEKAAEETENASTQVALFRTFVRELPYIAMLGTALAGIGIVSFTGKSLTMYWLFLAPIYGLMCVVAGWPHAKDREQQFRLIWKQALHWLTFLVAMFLVTSSEVRGVENNNSTGLNLMTVLASGTFVAGVHADAWQVCVVGALLALAVPGVAWIEQSALMFILAAALVVFVIASLVWTAHMQKRGISKDL